MDIKILQLEDLSDVAKIHIVAFPNSALTLLGHEALRLYYEWQLTGPHDVVALGIIDQAKIIGFCFSGRFQGALSGYLRKNRFLLLKLIIMRPWLFLNRNFRKRFWRGLNIFWAMLNPSKPKKKQRSNQSYQSFGILSIAIDPDSQGIGRGKLLMREIEKIAQQRGVNVMGLTVSPDNYQAIEFYKSLGWEKRPEHGPWKGRMIKNLK